MHTYTQMCTHKRFKGIPTHRCAHTRTHIHTLAPWNSVDTNASKAYLHTDVHTQALQRNTYTQMCTHEVFTGIPTHRCAHTRFSKAYLRTDAHTQALQRQNYAQTHTHTHKHKRARHTWTWDLGPITCSAHASEVVF
jgi:hypothetical protein